ncbi:MAG: uracil-DNA glycosylase [Patescibacteria group bacterium]
MDRTELLRQIKDEVLNLKESPLYQERVKNGVFPVIGEGNHHAKIMFIGEAPGRNEAKTGRPFCGAAGKILDELLASVGIDRKDIYITNIVKDRPPFNRDPLPKEIEIYGPFLDRQIEIIRPEVIATLGRFSMDYIMKKFGFADYYTGLTSIGSVHGKIKRITRQTDHLGQTTMVLYRTSPPTSQPAEIAASEIRPSSNSAGLFVYQNKQAEPNVLSDIPADEP